MILVLAFTLFSLLGFESSTPLAHEFHLSKCDIYYSEEDSALQISLRIFIDDLEEALAKVHNEDKLKLCTKKEVSHADSILVEYVSNNLKIKIDSEMKDLAYVGKEVSEDLLAVWCYFEIVDILPKNLIEIDNKVLIETFSDQSNMVVLKYSKDKSEHFLLQKGETTGILELN